MVFAFGIIVIVMMIVIPTGLLVVLFYLGAKSRREEQDRFVRGFEVKLTTGEPPVLRPVLRQVEKTEREDHYG
jgi:hypothetical protein